MKCKNKEQEQEIVKEIFRVLEKQCANPTYYDLRVMDCEITLYDYIDVSSRRVKLDLRIDDNTLKLWGWGGICITITEDEKIKFLYLFNILKNQYIEIVLNKLKEM